MAHQLTTNGKPQSAAGSPFERFKHEIDELFDTWGSSLPLPAGWTTGPTLKTDVIETEDALQVTAELPGINEKDVEVTFDGDVITIRGEKKAEREEKKAHYHIKERSWGSFERVVAVPFDANPDTVQASFSKGVLKVVVPKPAEAKKTTKKIAVETKE